MDRNNEFIAKYKAEPKGYCPCVIDAKGVIYECPKGHLEALLELKEAKSKLEEIPNNMSPLFYMTAQTKAVVVDYENQLYSGELATEQQNTLKELKENELIQMNLIDIHKSMSL